MEALVRGIQRAKSGPFSLLRRDISIALDEVSTPELSDLGEVMRQGVDDCSVPITCCRMNDHSCSFVDHDHVLVLKDNVEG